MSEIRRPEMEPMLTPQEVATMFRVDAKTVTRWAKAGKLTAIKTLGGHRRLLSQIIASAEMSDLHLDVTERAEVATS